jgi:hypothetical protein
MINVYFGCIFVGLFIKPKIYTMEKTTRARNPNYATALMAGQVCLISGATYSSFDGVLLPHDPKKSTEKAERGGFTVISHAAWQSTPKALKEAKKQVVSLVSQCVIYAVKIKQSGFNFDKAVIYQTPLLGYAKRINKLALPGLIIFQNLDNVKEFLSKIGVAAEAAIRKI